MPWMSIIVKHSRIVINAAGVRRELSRTAPGGPVSLTGIA